jgi:murein DD-endopeptidase MepM/ murein hydrolase activator NlpD
MPSENARERKKQHRYTFVIVPDAKAEKTRTLSVSRLWLIVSAIGILILLTLLILAAVVYTPLGERLPITNQKLEAQYEKQMVDIQRQLRQLLLGINTLRGYNLRLRRAMGEKISTADSMALVSIGMNTPALGDDEISRSSARNDAPQQETPESGRQRYAGILNPATSPQGRRAVRPVQFPMTQPVDGFVTRGFSSDIDHFGVDFAGRLQSPVQASADGIVIFSGWTDEDGYVIIVAHSGGFVSVYKHNQSLLRAAGDAVRRGEMIALLGNTGRTSTGPHLHFEVWRDGVVQDPANYLLTTQ